MHTIEFAQLLDLDRRAVLASVAASSRVTIGDLSRPTPCAAWAVADLLAHMSVQQAGFADAAAGVVTDLARWEPIALGAGAVAAYREASDRAVAAFAEPGVSDRDFVLPEIRNGGRFPAGLAIGFHLVDNVVHAWDLATSLGIALELDADVLRVALTIACAVPDGPERSQPGSPFAPALQTGDGVSTLDRILLVLGRSPDWRR